MTEERDDSLPRCAFCTEEKKICEDQLGSGPSWCPTLTGEGAVRGALNEYNSDRIAEIARIASIQEAECYHGRKPGASARPYPVKPRAREIFEFAGRMKYKRIGLAFCAGLANEARIFSEILESRGFEVVSVSCKIGRTPKERIGVTDEEKIYIGEFEAMCSPIAQARILDLNETQLNVVVGLCVGHDSLFFQHSLAPVTVLLAKDRVTGHNPAAALYTSNSYFRNILHGKR
jgi:uncharacterized metal-binding protein